MKKTLVMSFAALMTAFMMSGCTAMKLGTTFMGFPEKTQKAYANMFNIVKETGDPAQAMMNEWLITDDDLSEDDIFEDMKELAGDYNMRFVGDVKMFRLTKAENPTPDKVVHTRNAEFCSLSIAKKMLSHSRFFGGFMPCRVMLVEYGDGRRYLVSMNMDLAVYGGTDKKKISPKLFEEMKAVKKAMEEIPMKAAGYDSQEEADQAMADYYAAHGIHERLAKKGE